MGSIMKAKLCNFNYNYFSHLDKNELQTIKEREAYNFSFCFKVFDEKETFYVVLDVDKESVHVRHIGGSFAWKWKYIEQLCRVVAKEINLKKITVVADQAFMVFAVGRLGFEQSNGDIYEKVI